MATFCTASEPRVVSGTRGQYRVVEIPDIAHPFELTDDLKFAVVQFDGGFNVHSALDGQRIGKYLKHSHGDWKVVGSRLIVANDNGWELFSLPELQAIGSIPGPRPLPGVSRSVAPVALTRGWYCHGLFYDDACEKIVASCRIPSAQGWIAGVDDIRQYAVSNPTSILPFEVVTKSRHVVLFNYDRVPVSPPVSGQTSARYGLRWMTLQGKASFNFGPVSQDSGLYIELMDHDFSKYNMGERTLVGWNTPSLLLDPKANFADWKMLVLPTDTLGDARLLINPRDAAPINLMDMVSNPQMTLGFDPFAFRAGALDLESSWLVNELQKADYAGIDEVVNRYLVEAVPEFELATGQKPKHIPVAFTVRFENAESLKQVVWADMTRAEVLIRFGKAVWKRETKRLLDEHNQAIMDHEQKTIQTNASNASMRTETITRKSAWLVNSIYLSLCLVFISGSFGSLYFIKRIRARQPHPAEPLPPDQQRSEQQRSEQQRSEPQQLADDPPIVQPQVFQPRIDQP